MTEINSVIEYKSDATSRARKLAALRHAAGAGSLTKRQAISLMSINSQQSGRGDEIPLLSVYNKKDAFHDIRVVIRK